MKIVVPLLLLSLLLAPRSEATEPGKPKERKEINFEGEVVEGAARQSLDSLTQTAKSSKKSKVHLYEKREQLRDSNFERVEELIETY